MEMIEYPIKFYRNKTNNVIYKGVSIDITISNVNCHILFNIVDNLLHDSNIKKYAVIPFSEENHVYDISIDKKRLVPFKDTNIFLANKDEFLIETPDFIERNYIEMTADEVKRWNKVIYIKQCRQEIDNIIQKVREISDSNPVEYSLKGLTEGCMWLGMELKRLNQPDPYPSSKDPSTGDTIEPTADNLKL